MSLAHAKARLSALIDRVEAGETVTITRRGKKSRVFRTQLRLAGESTPKSFAP